MAQGKLLLRGPLLCTDDPSSGPNYKMKEMTVFLFEQIMIFAETVGKKTQFTSPVYTYKAHIQVGFCNNQGVADYIRPAVAASSAG